MSSAPVGSTPPLPVNQARSCIIETPIRWLRNAEEYSTVTKIVANILLALCCVVLSLTLVGIPVVWMMSEEYERQRHSSQISDELAKAYQTISELQQGLVRMTTAKPFNHEDRFFGQFAPKSGFTDFSDLDAGENGEAQGPSIDDFEDIFRQMPGAERAGPFGASAADRENKRSEGPSLEELLALRILMAQMQGAGRAGPFSSAGDDSKAPEECRQM